MPAWPRSSGCGIVEAVRDTDDGAWLAAVLDVHQAGAADGIRFDETIRLAPGPGQQPWWSAPRRAARDCLIRELAGTLPGPPTPRALAAAEAMRGYGGTGWRYDRARGGPLTSDARRKLRICCIGRRCHNMWHPYT